MIFALFTAILLFCFEFEFRANFWNGFHLAGICVISNVLYGSIFHLRMSGFFLLAYYVKLLLNSREIIEMR